MKIPNPEFPSHPLQSMLDRMSADWQRRRAETQLTLGGLIKQLEALDPKRKIRGFGKPMSYRGYYEDLAFAPSDGEAAVADALMWARGAMGRVFMGYKGGEFLMGERTPVWSAEYGACGERIMGLNAESDIVTLILAPDSE